MTDPSD